MLKEKRVQQILQALVEFQCKAGNMQQTITIIDAMHVMGVLYAITSRITRTVRVGERMRDREHSQRLGLTVLALPQAMVPP